MKEKRRVWCKRQESQRLPKDLGAKKITNATSMNDRETSTCRILRTAGWKCDGNTRKVLKKNERNTQIKEEIGRRGKKGYLGGVVSHPRFKKGAAVCAQRRRPDKAERFSDGPALMNTINIITNRPELVMTAAAWPSYCRQPLLFCCCLCLLP